MEVEWRDGAIRQTGEVYSLDLQVWMKAGRMPEIPESSYLYTEVLLQFCLPQVLTYNVQSGVEQPCMIIVRIK